MGVQIHRRSAVLLPVAIAVAVALSAAVMLRQEAPRVAAVGENSLTFPDFDPSLSGGIGSQSSMRLDAAGNPVVAYRAVQRELRLLHCNDPLCAGDDESVEIVLSGLEPTVPPHPSLALDAAGNPIFSINYGAGGGVIITHCNDPDCAGGDESIVTHLPGQPVNESQGVMAPGDLPVVVFRRFNQGMQMVRCANTNCTTVSNDPAFVVQAEPAFALQHRAGCRGLSRGVLRKQRRFARAALQRHQLRGWRRERPGHRRLDDWAAHVDQARERQPCHRVHGQQRRHAADQDCAVQRP